MLLAGSMVVGFWVGLIILIVTSINHLKNSINRSQRQQLRYYIPNTYVRKDKNRFKNKISSIAFSILLWILVALTIAGIFGMLETHESSDSQLHGNERGIKHSVLSTNE